MTDIQQRIRQTSLAMLDIIDDVLRTLAPTPAPNRPPPAVVRRQVANTLALWHACPQRTCQRARCCRGEPSHCLRIGLPLLPPDVRAALDGRKRRRRRPS